MSNSTSLNSKNEESLAASDIAFAVTTIIACILGTLGNKIFFFSANLFFIYIFSMC